MALIATALIHAACSQDPQVLKARHVENADRYRQQQRLPEAVIEYRNAVQAVPTDGEVRLTLADTYLEQGDATRAVAEYIRAADLLTDRLDVQLRAGHLLLLGGRFDDAKVRADKALAVAPNDAAAHILLANALGGLKSFDAALTEIEEAIRLDPASGAAYAGLGAIEAGRGRLSAAEEALKKAVDLDRTSVAARLALGNFYWTQKRWSDAERALKGALTLEPENLTAVRGMAILTLALGRPAETEEYLKTIRDVSHAVEASLALADFYVQRGNGESARAILEPMTTTPGAATAATARLAMLDYTSGRQSEGRARLEQALAAEPSHLEALLSKSGMEFAEGRLHDALAAAQAAVKSHPQVASAHFALGRAQRALGQFDAAAEAFKETLRLNPRTTGAHVALAGLNLGRGRTADAVSAAESAIRSNAADPNARLALVRSLIARGELQRAQPELTRLVTDFPNSAPVRTQNGILLARRNDAAGARREFEHALSIGRDSADALNGLVMLDLAARQPDVARARVKPYVEDAASPPAVLMVAARTYIDSGDPSTGEQLLRRIQQADPSFLPAYTMLGHLYRRLARLDEALVEFDTVIGRDPKSVPALTITGLILQQQGKTAEAQQRYERALAIEPTAAVAANNLAWILATTGGNLDVALQLAQTAYSKSPSNPEIGHTLGFIYYKKDLLPQSIEILTATVGRAPKEASYHHHLGLALAKNGDTTRATDHLTRALRLKPDFDGAGDARAALQALGAQN